LRVRGLINIPQRDIALNNTLLIVWALKQVVAQVTNPL
jgi:hypothetical protein